jgi:hypothetical protein
MFGHFKAFNLQITPQTVENGTVSAAIRKIADNIG